MPFRQSLPLTRGRRRLRRVERADQGRVAMQRRPTGDIEVGADRDDCSRAGHAMPEQHGQDAATAVAEQHHARPVPAVERRFQGTRHALHDRFRVPLVGP